jgi:hypothetical protein
LTLCFERSGNEASPQLKMTDLQWWTVRDPQWGAPLWARALLVAAALGLVGLRFADRDLVPYILDEAHFQDAARMHARAGTWPSISPLTGNLGVAYGPAPVWFYTAVHHLVGPRPERSVLAVTLFLSLAELLLAAALARALRGGWLLFATLTALLAASPFLFFWSRLAWDVFSGYIALAVALLARDRALGVARGALLGVLLGLALTSHPMTVPVALATLAVLSWEAVRRRAGAAGLMALLASLVLVHVPYLWALHAARRAAAPPGPGLGTRLFGVPARLGGELLEPARVLTTSGVDYFFDTAWPDFRGWLGPAGALLALGPILAITLALLAAAGLLLAARTGGPGARRVARVGLLAWVGLAALLSGLELVIQPHYQLAACWLVPAGVGALAMALLPRHPMLARGLLACVWVLALAEATFNQAWMRWVRERGGTAGIHYSVPLAAQRALLQAACSTDRPQVALANRTYLFADSLLSLAETEPACAGKRLGVCAGNCPALDARWRVVSLRYVAPPGGRLAPLVR